MSVLSSLLGVGRPQQLAGPMQTTAFPEELAPYYKDILSKSQALYEDRTKEGFQPYQGPTMAEFTPEQQQAFTGIAGLQGTQAPKFAEAEQLTKQAATAVGAEDIEQFMNPYQQAVVDIEKREAQKQFEQKTLPSIRAAQVAQGSFGGTRGSLLESQTLEGQNRLLSDIQSRGSKQAYEQALQMAQAQKAREGQAGAQLAVMAPQAFKAQLGELGAVQTVGEEKQRQAQTALNEAYKQFLDERQFPQQSLAQYQGVVQAQPASQMLESVQYAPPGPSTSQQLLGGLGTLVGTYGAFGGFSPGGVFGNRTAKTGGGIGELPVIKKGNGGGFFDYFTKDEYGQRPITQDLIFLARPKFKNKRKYTLAGDIDNNKYNIDNITSSINPTTVDTMEIPDEDPRLKFTNIDPIGLEDVDTSKYAGGFNRPIQDMTGVMDAQEAQKVRIAQEKFNQLKGSAKNLYTRLKSKLKPDDKDSAFASDVDSLKTLGTEALGEYLDTTEAVQNYGVNKLNKIRSYFGYNPISGTDESGVMRAGIAKLIGSEELTKDKNLKEEYKKLADKDKGLLAKLSGNENLLQMYNRLKKEGKSESEIEKTINKIKSKTNELKDTAKEIKDKTVSKLGQDDKKEESAIVEKVTPDGQKVITNVKPNEANKLVNETIKKEGKKLEQLVKDVKDNPDDIKKKKTLSSTREAYLNLLEKQQNDLGKQQGNIDDSRRKSMFEFLAKVSSRYGKGENLSDAAAGELDGAMQRTRQLDQANLDLKGKQREAELNVAKETMGIEEKKASAKIAADKAKKEDTRKGQELYINYLKANNEGGKSLKTLGKDGRKILKKSLSSYDSFDEIRNQLGDNTRINITGMDSKNINNVLPKLFKNERFLTDLNTEMSQYKFSPGKTVDSTSVFNQAVRDLLASGNYKWDEKDNTFLFGTVKLGKKGEIN